jgi:hypothetical protein
MASGEGKRANAFFAHWWDIGTKPLSPFTIGRNPWCRAQNMYWVSITLNGSSTMGPGFASASQR